MRGRFFGRATGHGKFNLRNGHRTALALASRGVVRYSFRMVSLPKPEIVITHESDLDGLVSGVLLQRLAEKVFGVKVPLEAHHYHTWRQRDIREVSGWVSDLAFESRLDRLNWLIVDHHTTCLLYTSDAADE